MPGANPPASTPNDFRGVLARGRMAAIGNFRVEPTATGSRVSTETWVAIHALGQAVPFTTYWLLIGPFSAWIRRLLLRAGRSRALLLAFPPASSAHRSA